MIKRHGKNVLVPMRYNLRPHWSQEELSQKYNLFNARMDALQSRRSWKKLLGRRHCAIPYKAFYEFVYYDKIKNSDLKKSLADDEKAKLISFWSQTKEILWSPGLFDLWKSPCKKHYFLSAALITTHPSQQIKDSGHDRSPVFLSEDLINNWLDTENINGSEESLKILQEHQEQQLQIVV